MVTAIAIAFVFGLVIGAWSYRLYSRRPYISPMEAPSEPLVRSRAFTASRGKLKPKVNDDRKAWAIENKRELNQ